MKLISLITLLFTLLLFLQNCGWGFQIDKGSDKLNYDKFTGNYILENGTEHRIELKFYHVGSQYFNLEEQNILNNKGDIFSRSIRESPRHNGQGYLAFQNPDSLVIIFDDSRKGKIFWHRDITGDTIILEGIDKNIFFSEVYTLENYRTYVNYRYVFIRQDYDNAIDCNGNCD